MARMTTRVKKFLAGVGTVVVGLILTGIAVKQCSDKKSAAEESKDTQTALVDAYKSNAALRKDSIAVRDTLKAVRHERDSLSNEVALRDSVIANRDTTIAVLMQDLKDCESNKKPVAKTPAKKTTPAKQPAKKTTPAKTVSKPAEQKPAPVPTTHVEFNDDAHCNTVNVNNGVINNYYGNAADTVVRAVNEYVGKRKVVIVGNKRELCY